MNKTQTNNLHIQEFFREVISKDIERVVKENLSGLDKEELLDLLNKSKVIISDNTDDYFKCSIMYDPYLIVIVDSQTDSIISNYYIKVVDIQGSVTHSCNTKKLDEFVHFWNNIIVPMYGCSEHFSEMKISNNQFIL